MSAGFDLRVHIRDKKTGRLTHAQPYRMKVEKGQERFERPVDSGNWWTRDGEPIGEHKEYIAPMTSDQKVKAAIVGKDNQISELEAKIAKLEADAIKEDAVKPQEDKEEIVTAKPKSFSKNR